MKRTKLDILYLLLCFQLTAICAVLAWISYFGRVEITILNTLGSIYWFGFAIFFGIMFDKLFKKTQINWIDKILLKFSKER